MDLGIAGRSAFVAASTAGLGWAVARALSDEGARVAVTGRRGDLAAQRAAELPDAVGLALDLEKPESVRAALEQTQRRLGPIDIVVLNGPGPSPGRAIDMRASDLLDAAERLLMPHQLLIEATVPGMCERGWGRVLAIGSSGVRQPIPGLTLSNTFRSALAALLKTLAAEIARFGVTVNMALPGRVATDRIAQLDRARAERDGVAIQDVQAASRADIPAGRYGRPEEFGAVAAFLCSDRASYVTGAQVPIDGGLIRGL